MGSGASKYMIKEWEKLVDRDKEVFVGYRQNEQDEKQREKKSNFPKKYIRYPYCCHWGLILDLLTQMYEAFLPSLACKYIYIEIPTAEIEELFLRTISTFSLALLVFPQTLIKANGASL